MKNSPGFFLGFAFGCMVCLGLHYYIRCDQADRGHPLMSTEGKRENNSG